jgi:hypothetical protein
MDGWMDVTRRARKQSYTANHSTRQRQAAWTTTYTHLTAQSMNAGHRQMCVRSVSVPHTMLPPQAAHRLRLGLYFINSRRSGVFLRFCVEHARKVYGCCSCAHTHPSTPVAVFNQLLSGLNPACSQPAG